MLNDHKINRISLFFSIIIHVGLVIFSLIMLSNPIEISHDLPPVPIEFSIKEIIIQKTISKPTIQKPPPITKPSKAPPAKSNDDRQKPLLESHKDPYYPKEAINFSLEGTVVVNVLVNTQGRVSDVTIVKSSGHTILDESFISTIKSTYIFKPKHIDGVNVIDTVTLSHTFSL
ncbi:MAG: hypothetical protein CL503_00675 [Actinobacteria bacterium]|nr:hypothetical protein [Actinomycetota bacterium]|tara:strand:+ start:17670 stop:18188 length:519 start_codon:yes stop_codon:yes gene_type:complete